jgi:AcrR family transcriptional regulator
MRSGVTSPRVAKQSKVSTQAGKSRGADRGALLERVRTTKQRARKRCSGRPTTLQSGKLRETLMHAALHSFLERGFEATSLEAIARDAKVAKITIYRQFGSKTQLFLEATHYAQTYMQKNLSAAVGTEGPPEKVLRAIIARLRDVTTDPDYLAILRMEIAAAPNFPNIAAMAVAETGYALEPLIEYLQQLKDKGIIVVDDAREAALQLSAVAGGGVRYLLKKRSRSLAASTHWVESVYTLFARAWGLAPIRRATPSPKK